MIEILNKSLHFLSLIAFIVQINKTVIALKICIRITLESDNIVDTTPSVILNDPLYKLRGGELVFVELAVSDLYIFVSID